MNLDYPLARTAFALWFIAIVAPNALFADDDKAQLQVFLCQTPEEVAAYSFLQRPDGTLSLIGNRDATVSKSSSALTVLLGDKVLQFQDNRLQTLENGTLQSSNCADVTSTIAEMSQGFALIEAETPLQFGAVVPVSAPTGSSSPPMTGAEREALRVAINSCWNLEPGSVAARVTVEVGFNLTRDGRVDGEPRLMSSSGDQSAAAVAFEHARRAILRCQGVGYDLPSDKFDQWSDVTLTFDPEQGVRLR